MLPATEKNLKSFGFIMGAAFAILACLVLWRRGLRLDALPVALLVAGALFAALAALAPRSLVVAYKPWMGLAHVLGQAMTLVLMTVFYFTILIPFTLIRFKDPLRLAFRKDSSYWEPYRNPETTLERFQRPF
jgi:hypothetical protein